MNLPQDSALARERGEWWTPELELAATNVDLLHANYRGMLAVNGAKRVPKAFTVPRPGPTPIAGTTPARPVRPKATQAQVLAMLAMTHKPVGG